MHDMIVFGDIHTDPGCLSTITNLLPELNSQGYDTFYMEASPRHTKEILKEINSDIKHLEAFPDGEIPRGTERTKAQENVLKTYKSYANNPETAIAYVKKRLEFLAGRLEWSRARKAMLEKAMELKIRLICIDVENTNAYNYAGGHGERSLYMLNKIDENLSKNPNSKSILLTGFAHLIDIVEDDNIKGWVYSRGMLRTMLNRSDVNVNHSFLIYSKHTDAELRRKAIEGINRCAPEIVRNIKLVCLKKQQITDSLQSLVGMSKCYFEKANALNENQYRVLIFQSISKDFLLGYIKTMQEYISDLGGKNIETVGNSRVFFIQFDINSYVLNSNERLKRLGLERAFVSPTLDNSKIGNLQEQVLGITIEIRQGGRTLLTYIPNKEIENRIKSICPEVEKFHMKSLKLSQNTFNFFKTEFVAIKENPVFSDLDIHCDQGRKHNF